MEQKRIIKNTIFKLRNNFQPKHVWVGFDGFIDDILEVVKTRKNAVAYERVLSISEFSENIGKMSGLSGNIELVSVETRLGGNGPIMANELLKQGYEVSFCGALGEKEIDPLFSDFAGKCKDVISLTDPGHTDALEFFDGKVMFGRINLLAEVNWQNLLDHISEKQLIKLMENISLIAITNWSTLLNLNSIISGLSSICSRIDNRPAVFFDLADPKKRSKKDILEVLELMTNFQENAVVILGLNKNESEVISSVLQITETNIVKRAVRIREKLQISAVTIHPLNGAAVAIDKGSFWFDGPFTSKPKLTTGAGDNYNAGFCNGWISGFTPAECLAVGVYTSGFYVRNCHSPNREELIQFMESFV